MMQVRRPIHAVLHIAVGTLLGVLGLGLMLTPEAASAGSVLARVLLGMGLVALILAALDPNTTLARVSLRLCLALLVTIVALAIGEFAGRLIGIDFDRQEAAERRLPPFFRSPRVPVPPVFFRRGGPEVWTGQVMRTGVRLSGITDELYHDEPVITVRYDRLGFRDENGLADWEIAVAGDSFVELGFLPFEQLYTTRLAALTGQRVRNLGVSHTGPLTHLRYLELHGLSSATRVVAIVFYEGNDLNDLAIEDEAMRRFDMTGQRDFRGVQRQTSLLRTLATIVSHAGTGTRLAPARINARLMTSTGEQPATFITRLVPGMVLKPAMEDAVDRFLGSYAAFAAQHGVAPWLIFMPCKTRALAGRFRWEPPSEETDVGLLPLNLPEILRLRCERAGVAFYDITPGLTNRAGDALVFNAVVDSHLNAAGAEIVAGLLADQFAGKGIPRQTRSMLPPGGGSAAADAKMDCREEAQNAQGRGDPTSDLPPCPLTAGSRVP